MIDIRPHIKSLKSYNPGKTIEEYRSEFGFKKTAVLWNNENNTGVPQKAVERMSTAAAQVNVYPDPLSTQLRDQLAKLNGVERKNIVVGNGSESILSNLYQTFCSEGDEMVTCAGTFVAVYIWAQSHNVNVKKVPLNNEFGFDLNQMRDAVTPKTKILYISNANNPTGTAINEEDLQAFIQSIPRHILVVIDEAYFEYSRQLMPDYPDTSNLLAENVLTLRTFSKAYGLAGVRLGYAAGPEKLIDALNKVRMTFEPSLITQQAGIGALEDKAFLSSTLKLNSKWIRKFHDMIDEKGFIRSKSVANFVMLNLETEQRAEDFTHHMLKNGVFVRRLPAFGLPHCVRISTGTESENEYFSEVFNYLKI